MRLNYSEAKTFLLGLKYFKNNTLLFEGSFGFKEQRKFVGVIWSCVMESLGESGELLESSETRHLSVCVTPLVTSVYLGCVLSHRMDCPC